MADVLRSPFLTTGPEVERFEEALARKVGARRAVAVANGTSALLVAYQALGVGPDDEIVTTPLTFASTANAARALGAWPRFADVDPRTGNIEPDALRAAIGTETRFVVVVDLAGHPVDYDAISEICAERDLPLVSDSAHALGARHRGRPLGSLARLTTFSFHPVKTATTGEGGAITTDDDDLADRMIRLRNHGMEHDPRALRRADGAWSREQVELSLNHRISDIQCALGRSQLSKLDDFLGRRRAIAARYAAELADVPGIALPLVAADVEHAWHLYVVRVDDPDRRKPFFDALRSCGLGVQVHYLPVYRHPYYEDLGYPEGLCPGAEDFYNRAVSIPIYPAMTEDDVDRVVEAVRSTAKAVL